MFQCTPWKADNIKFHIFNRFNFNLKRLVPKMTAGTFFNFFKNVSCLWLPCLAVSRLIEEDAAVLAAADRSPEAAALAEADPSPDRAAATTMLFVSMGKKAAEVLLV